jgi:hypothetical protein
VRVKQRPAEPQRNEVELAFLSTGLGDQPDSASQRDALSSGTGMALYVDERGPLTVDSGSTRTVGSLQLTAPGEGNIIVATELDGTATGSGTVTVTYTWLGSAIGPSVNQQFTAGPFHLSATWAAPGITGSDVLYANARVTSGTGSVAVAASDARTWVLASGTVGGGTSTAPRVVTNELIATGNVIGGADTVTTSLDAPAAVTPGESVVTGSAHTVTDTVTTQLN